MSLVTVGTLAFDSIETPFGKVDRIVGGAGTYIAWASSYFCGSKMISVIGGDFPETEINLLKNRQIDFEGVEVRKNEKSFFWSGKYHLDMNHRDTLETQLNVLADFKPVVPESYQDGSFLMLGNLSPDVQRAVIEQFRIRPKLIVMDTMNFWMNIAREELDKTIALVDLLMLNDSEARQLTNEYSLITAANKIMAMGPKYVVIKKGEHGAFLFYKDEIFFAPALPLEVVFDPTGAGDSFAGGFIGYLAKTNDISFGNLKKALIYGSALASFAIEKFGTERLYNITEIELQNRIDSFKKLVHF